MNITVDEIAYSILKKPFRDCNAYELQQLAERYPYFGPAHFLLAKKLQEKRSSQYGEQVQKTSLYFQNRVWLDHLLNNGTPSAAGATMEQKTFIDEKIQAQSPVADPAISMTIQEERKGEPIAHADHSDTIQSTGTSSQFEHDMDETHEETIRAAAQETTGEDEGNIRMPEFDAEASAPDSRLIFEPYHTVDYFASQGIQFREEEKPGDLFGRQLKSFTEWLKTMKRLPASEIATVGDPGRERKVEILAEHSIAERHIVTEAMAAVWEKQGNKAKAEEIYRKLSLLDPSKSSYFAAKIEALKKPS